MKTRLLLILCLLILVNKSYTQVNQNKHFVGEIYGGGIVFYVEENGNHGLIASTNDIIKDTPWASKQAPLKAFPSKPVYNTDKSLRTLPSDVDGAYNTKMIIECRYANSAAWHCSNYVVDSYHDWYLPAIDELKKLIGAKSTIDNVLNKGSIKGAEVLSEKYWSSTNTELEPTGTWAFIKDFKLANMFDSYLNVRAVRRF
jgi:hypothetical protein